MNTRLVNARHAVTAALLAGFLLAGLAACAAATAAPTQTGDPNAAQVVTQPAHGSLNADRYYDGANVTKDRSPRTANGSINADRYYEDANLANH